MGYVNVVVWKARPGNEQHLEEILVEMVKLTRREPGCRVYQVHRSTEYDGVFLIYEHFADQAAFDVHNDAEYFRRLVLEQAVPMLESRERSFYTTDGFD